MVVRTRGIRHCHKNISEATSNIGTEFLLQIPAGFTGLNNKKTPWDPGFVRSKCLCLRISYGLRITTLDYLPLSQTTDSLWQFPLSRE
jgi:hypothetical protein